MPGILSLIAALALVAIGGSAVQAPDALLKRSDVGAFVPESFRARLVLSRGTDADSEIELWRSGQQRTLIRFIDPKERGKFLLRRDADLWLITPGTKKPTRLSPSHRVYGAATIDVLFGLQLAADYRIESVSVTAVNSVPATAFELRSRSDDAQFAAVQYIVDTASARPISARYRLRSGREATFVQFERWSANGRYAHVVLVTDLLRKGPPTRVEVREFEERPVPEGLFDLQDATARNALDRSNR